MHLIYETLKKTGGKADGDALIAAAKGMRWESPDTVRLEVRPELINAGGLLSGAVTYALVDYCMGSTLWAQTAHGERIATIGISINYVQTATEGEVVCRSVLEGLKRAGLMTHQGDDRFVRVFS